MTFTVKIALQPFEVSFEAGSIGEAVAILQEPGNELSKLAALATGASEEEETTTAEPDKPARKPRKPRAAVEAVAPPPIPVPDAAPPAPPAPVDTGIPAFLDRTVAVAPPPMVAPPAPPAPATPPVGVFGGMIVAELERRKATSADNGRAILEWLWKKRVDGGCELIIPDCDWTEAVDFLRFTGDEKLEPVAKVLKLI